MADERDAQERGQLERALAFIVAILIAYRLAYHATYLGEVPFAHGTFADGAVYVQAARDILDHPPLGTRAFYLQGAYAYFLALAMAVRSWPSLAILLQVPLALASFWLLHRSATKLWGRRAALLSTIVLLAHPGLAFYENKHLSAELGIACNIVVIAAFVGVLGRRRELGRRALLALVGLGAASGLAILARPNMILALPFTLVGVAVLVRGQSRAPRSRALALALVLFGVALALAPMAARNLAVTGHPDVQPVHGGGTSFYIGNNPKSKGVWNDAGLMSARLGTESHELALALGVDPELPERARARAIGDALYGRAFEWIGQNPGTWLKLEVHKLWLTVGDQQLTQDYDWLGEQELLPWAHRVGVRFSLLLALGLLGAGAVFMGRGRPRSDLAVGVDEAGFVDGSDGSRAALAWFLAGQLLAPLAANLLFFTSAQHRLPLVIPIAFLAGPGLLALVATIRARLGSSPAAASGAVQTLPLWLVALAILALAQGPWRRSHRSHPHPVHYYNLAMVQDEIGEPVLARQALDRAIELRPDQPIFHMRRAHLRLRLADLTGAESDLAVVFSLAEAGDLPDWILDQAERDRASVAYARAEANWE